jgi:hypothetical protein
MTETKECSFLLHTLTAYHLYGITTAAGSQVNLRSCRADGKQCHGLGHMSDRA